MVDDEGEIFNGLWIFEANADRDNGGIEGAHGRLHGHEVSAILERFAWENLFLEFEPYAVVA